LGNGTCGLGEGIALTRMVAMEVFVNHLDQQSLTLDLCEIREGWNVMW
jgi:hypothetical protein